MSCKELLGKYSKEIVKLRKLAKELSLTEEETDRIFKECFQNLKCTAKINKAQQTILNIFKALFILIFILLCFYIILNVHQPTTSIVLRNVQGLIYPGLSLLRFLSVPIIRRFPSLTRLYDESCLLENPFFYLPDMECWPCQNVYTVLNLTEFHNYSLYQTGIPYIMKINQPSVTYKTITQMYLENREMFDKDANVVQSTNSSLTLMKDLLNYVPSSDNHISWRINRMQPAQVVRKIFPRPFIISEWSGQTVERYIMIDEPKTAPYHLPNFECSYVFVVQGSGRRTIVLKPTLECLQECKTISVVLEPSYVLWYNWWYWKPISLPIENATDISITYINSYC